MPPQLFRLLAHKTQLYDPVESIEQYNSNITSMARTKPAKQASQAMSSELGNGDFAVNFNTRTGRPIRKARKADSPFVDSAIAITDEETSEDEAVPMLTSRSRKRKRSPSPPLSDSDADEEELSDDGESDHDAIAVRPRCGPELDSTPGMMQVVLKDITINVPPGHVGPLVLHITPELMVPMPVAPTQTSKRQMSRDQKRPTKKQCQSAEPNTRAGFLDLPAELRNEIYRMTFVGEGRLTFANPTSFSKSAAFLRTCSQVHEEARSILYAENEFLFARRTSRYGSFWEDEWKELGFRVSVCEVASTVSDC